MTIEDIDIMQKIGGEDIAHLKGKMVRRTPKWVVNDSVTALDELKEQNNEIIPHVDVSHVNGMGLLEHQFSIGCKN